MECQRRISWDLLRQLSHESQLSWLVIGDFNEITNSYKKKGGRLRLEKQMQRFRDMLDDWERGHSKATNIRERLDHGVSTLDWFTLYPNYLVQHLSHSFSDHYPILMDTNGKLRNGNSWALKHFRFEANWCLDEAFEENVKLYRFEASGSIPTRLIGLGKLGQVKN